MVMARLFLLLLAHLIMTGLPGATASLAAARKGVKQVPVLVSIALAASGSVAMLTFWLYFAEPLIGKVFSYLILLVSAAGFAWLLRRGRVDATLRQRLCTPTALWALGSIFVVFLGFVHGGTNSPVSLAATRFTGFELPSDNDIPQYFATWFFTHGHNGVPPLYPPDWLASDRPPLQIGYVLTQRSLGWDTRGLNYQLLAVVLQQFWIVALWALLVAARVGDLTRALTVIAVLVSDLAIVNGFYVWPKMLPAAMLICVAALVLTPLWSDVRRERWGAALIGSLLALAMLGHGSSIFGVIALGLAAAVRGMPDRRWVALAVAVGALLYVPWSAYQKYGDPPGDRLTKWMLAGDTAPGKRSTVNDVIDAYRSAGLGGTIHDKAENFVAMAGAGPMVSEVKTAVDAATSGDFTTTINQIRAILFFNLLPSFGLLLIAPLAMALARLRHPISSPEWRFALVCYAVVAVGAIAWGLILFGNDASRTVLHQGSYAVPILGICAAIAGTRAAFPRFAIYLVSLNAILSLAIYFPVISPPPHTSYMLPAIVLTLAGLIGFAAVALRGMGRTPEGYHFPPSASSPACSVRGGDYR